MNKSTATVISTHATQNYVDGGRTLLGEGPGSLIRHCKETRNPLSQSTSKWLQTDGSHAALQCVAMGYSQMLHKVARASRAGRGRAFGHPLCLNEVMRTFSHCETQHGKGKQSMGGLIQRAVPSIP